MIENPIEQLPKYINNPQQPTKRSNTPTTTSHFLHTTRTLANDYPYKLTLHLQRNKSTKFLKLHPQNTNNQREVLVIYLFVQNGIVLISIEYKHTYNQCHALILKYSTNNFLTDIHIFHNTNHLFLNPDIFLLTSSIKSSFI